MRRYALTLFAVLTLWIVGDHGVLAQNQPDDCGPLYRRDKAETDRVREEKKARLRREGMPERFMHLLDKEECPACVLQASDAFHIMIVYNDDQYAPRGERGRITKHSFKWDPRSEREAREDLAAGRIKAFYIFNTLVRCNCCPEVNDDHRTPSTFADWDPSIEANRSHVIEFNDKSDLGPLPDDLVAPPPGWDQYVPEIQQFRKPSRRFVHVMCPACEPLAEQWNALGGTLDQQWNEKVAAMNRASIIRNAIANRDNEIALAEYQQRFASTRSAANQARIDSLKQASESQRDDLSDAVDRISAANAAIAKTQAAMDALMQKILECEKACRKTTAAAPAAPTVTASISVDAKDKTDLTYTEVPPTYTLPNATPANATPPATAAEPPPSPAPGAATVCPECQAAANEVARLQQLIESRSKALPGLQDEMAANSSLIANLEALRNAATVSGDTAGAATYDGRIAPLRQANADLRAGIFQINEEIRALNNALAAAVRALEACLKKCGQSIATMPEYRSVASQSPVIRDVTAGPAPTTRARCQACEALATQLAAAHRELQQLAERANARRLPDDMSAFEDQRAKVADLERQLAQCNAACTTDAPQVVGDPAPPQVTVPASVCPQCRAAAERVAQLEAAIGAQRTEINRIHAAMEVNAAQTRNVETLRDLAIGDGNSARAAELDARLPALRDGAADLRAREFAANENIARLNDELAAAVRALEACLKTCGQSMATMADYNRYGNFGTDNRKRTVTVRPLDIVVKCPQCQGLADRLRAAQRELEERAKRANAVMIDEEFARFEDQRMQVDQLKGELERCNGACQTTTTAPTSVTAPTPAPNAVAPPQVASTSTATPTGVSGNNAPANPTASAVPAQDRNIQVDCIDCQDLANELQRANQALSAATDQLRTARAQNASGQALTTALDAHAAAIGQVAGLERKLDECNKLCKMPQTWYGVRPCPGCEHYAYRMNRVMQEFAAIGAARQAGAPAAELDRRVQLANEAFMALNTLISECNRVKCGKLTSAAPPPLVDTIYTPLVSSPDPTSSCVGAACDDEWRTCTADNSCTPIDRDCGVPGTPGCPFANPPGVQTVDLTDPKVWGPVMTLNITITLDQYKYMHALATNETVREVAIVFPATEPEPVRSWFNPFGLLASRIRDQVDRWRGSVGPRPFITNRDLKVMDATTNAQAAGLPRGVHMLLTDRGGSTGKTLGLQLLNFSGSPVRLSSIPLAIEPLDRKASQAAQQAFAKLSKVLPRQIDLSAYCVEFLKAPPSANTIYRLAPKAIQDKFAPISKVLRSAYRIEHAGVLNPDSNPAAYTDSIKQWAVWAVEQKFNERSFTDAFVGHTRKNVEGAGQKWSKDAEAVIRKISPNRWQDISKILRGAGLPLPQ